MDLFFVSASAEDSSAINKFVIIGWSY